MINKKTVIASIFFTLLVTLAVLFRPVPTASAENTLKTFGTIERVYDDGGAGVVFKLRGDNRIFYIEKGLPDGLTANALHEDLSGQPVAIYYVKYWTPLDPMSRLKHIAKVEVNRTTLYSSIK